MNRYFDAALRLHQYLANKHWDGHALVGPDPGLRINYRIGRFIKSYLDFVPWRDNLCYLQAQGYWLLGNWALHTSVGDPVYGDIARKCSKFVIQLQREDGAWEYPNPEWKGRVATAEGTWAALGLLESFRHTGEETFLDAVLRWHDYLINQIGFQQTEDELTINYFANLGSTRVPNNSITVLRFLIELAQVTNDPAYAEPCQGLLVFIRRVQKPSGEFPYTVSADDKKDAGRPHFQCYQYNAFACLNLIRYYELTHDDAIVSLIGSQIEFLRGGVGQNGQSAYDCGERRRTVTYHTAALAAAFARANETGLAKCDEMAQRAYGYVWSLQRSDGGFPHSQRDYGILTDHRSYPRYLAMILLHLLCGNRS